MITKQKCKRIKVAVALSGGVDSSVVVALLKQQGFEVVGMHMRLWKARPNKTSQLKTEKRVRQACKVLDIPLKVFDLQKEFKQKVVEYFLAELKKGKTPNPCVVCNKQIKFGLLMEKAKALGCDFLATGHYARLTPQFSIFNFQFSNKSQLSNFKILKARNQNKDQTYFLWGLKQNQLKHVLFPLGEIESKQKTRELAKKFNLPTAKTQESNDICFLQDTTLRDFLIQNLAAIGLPRTGKILDKQGMALGEHCGLWFYTVGQRKGLSIQTKKGIAGFPWFVVDKDIKKNALIVGQNQNDLLKNNLIAQNVNWLSNIEPKLPLTTQVKIRYGSLEASAVVKEKISKGKYKVVFARSQKAITPGQSVVFYKGDELLGGGIIEK